MESLLPILFTDGALHWVVGRAPPIAIDVVEIVVEKRLRTIIDLGNLGISGS